MKVSLYFWKHKTEESNLKFDLLVGTSCLYLKIRQIDILKHERLDINYKLSLVRNLGISQSNVLLWQNVLFCNLLSPKSAKIKSKINKQFIISFIKFSFI